MKYNTEKKTNIHIERAKHNITQKQLAKKVGVTRQTIHSIESGKFIAGLPLALKIAQFFRTTIEDLFT